MNQEVLVVGDRIGVRLLPLVQNFHIAAALFAGLRLHRPGAAFDFPIGDALGRAAEHAFDPHGVPHRSAEPAGAEARAIRAARLALLTDRMQA